MIKWIKMEGCRKKALSVYLHGSGEDCLSQIDSVLCDNCERTLEKTDSDWKMEVKQGQKRKRDEETREVSDTVAMKEMIKDIKDKCPLCWMNGKQEDIKHLVTRCP